MLDLSRRDFARLLALTGSAALFPDRAVAQATAPLRELGLSNAPLRADARRARRSILARGPRALPAAARPRASSTPRICVPRHCR